MASIGSYLSGSGLVGSISPATNARVSYINPLGSSIRSGVSSVGNTGVESGLKKASEQAEGYLKEARALYEPYSATGAASLDEYTKLLLGGVDALSDDKNFQAMQDLAEKKVMSNRAVSGLLRSGATASALDDTLLNFANAYYGNRLNQLGQGVGIGQQSIASEASILDKLGVNATDLASALANIQMQREANQSTIEAARAQAGATTSAASQTASAQQDAAIMSTIGSIATAALLAFSDKRLKTDLKLVGKSDNGLNIYLGRYTKESGLDDGHEHLFLIAQEVKEVVPEAVVENENGYLMVDYAKALGV